MLRYVGLPSRHHIGRDSAEDVAGACPTKTYLGGRTHRYVAGEWQTAHVTLGLKLARVVVSKRPFSRHTRIVGGHAMPATPIDLDVLAASLKARYEIEKPHLERLLGANLSTGERKNAKLIEKMAKDLHVALRRRGPRSREEAADLANDFINHGAKAVLLTGSQRGGDFLNNQIRGRWAERVVESLGLVGVTIVPFGPSGAAMPGEEDHREVIMTFMQVAHLEGKRPDLIAYATGEWNALAKDARTRAETWPNRILDPQDLDVVRRGRFGIEVKNSTWHYERRRTAGGGPLSITVKREEIEDIKSWVRRTGLPVLFFQVLFDEIYCMSFGRMLEAIARGHVYVEGDYELDEQTGADDKHFHRFHLNGFAHLCGKVTFPDESAAVVRVLPDGKVIPYIDFQPARADAINTDVVERELAYVPTFQA